MKRQLFLICLFWLVNSIQLFSQSISFLSGKVINSVTLEPLSFATIALKENRLGVFSNDDGDFKIAGNPKFQSDSLIITFIGFRRYTIPFKNLSEDKVNKIYLTPISFKLSEVKVVASRKMINSETIIRRAIRNIKKNYPVKPFNYVSYYRDYQKKDKSYINLNEAIVQTLDTGFNKLSKSNKFRLLDFRQNMDFQRLDVSPFYDKFATPDFDNPNKFIQNAWLPDQGGNELLILMIHDPIRNSQSETFSFVNIFSKDFISNHNFSKIASVYDNNLLLYKIGFIAKPYLTGGFLNVSGNIFIQPENYSIHKIEYSGSYLLKGNVKKKMFDVDIEYGRENSANSLMRLKYISFNNIFNVVDQADTTFFRVEKSYVEKGDISNSTLIIEFNHTPNVESASNKDFYEILFNGKYAQITKITVKGKNAIIKIKPGKTDIRISPKIEVAVRNIKDINGKILNKKKNLEFYQYRELFVQEYNKPLPFKESCYLQNVPLLQNCISKYTGDQKYWMNTPINTDTLKMSQSGYFGDPNLLVSCTEMTNERATDMLPVDLLPEPAAKPKSVPDLTDSPVEKYLAAQQHSIGKDQLFVQLDRNIYKPGDTIYFKAYIRDRFTGIFETKSVSMYALLFNENKAITDSSRFKISNSTSSGWMAIPAKAEFGKYHFVAFTSAMQNYDPADAFQLDLYVKKRNSNPDKISITFNKEKYFPGDTLEATIKITDPIGSPVNQQKFSGSFSTGQYVKESNETQTNKNGESLIRFILPDTITSQPRFKVTTKQNTGKESLTKDVTIPYEDPYFELKFLPEGGTFIEGLEQRIGFNAINFKGEPVFIEGLLKNSSGSVLDTIKSEIYGPGSFLCTSQPGLYVELIKGGGSEKKWPLPVPVAKGISLCVTPIDNRSFAVEIQSNNYNGELVMVSGTMNMTQVFSREIILSKKQRIVIDTDQLPAGVANITLFDKELRPIAERLFYVNSDKRLRFNIKADKVYELGKETELAISVTDGQGNPAEGFFSVAVTDAVKGIDPGLFTPGIEYAFNYHPHFQRNLPPKVLNKGLENMTDTERDLLLMVYGWSKFNWDFAPKQGEEKQLANYDLLNMRILYALKSRRADRSLDLVSLEGPSIRHLTTNNLGEISLPLDSLPDITRSVTLMPDVKNKDRAIGSMLSIPYNEQYFKSNKIFIPQPKILSDEYNISLPYQQYIPLGEKTIELPEIPIIGHQQEKKVYHDKYEEQYQYANVKSLDYEDIWASSSLESAIRRLVNPLSIKVDPFSNTIKSIVLRPSKSFLGGAVPALIVLDGTPLYSGDLGMVSSIPTNEITSLTILSNTRGYTIYGEAAQGGVIFVNTRSSDPNLAKLRTKWVSQNAKDKMLVPIDIYRKTIEYYNPTKLDLDTDPTLQGRATILWESEVYFDGKEPVKIKYTNLNHNGPVVIIINGVSVNNLVGTGSASYLVQ
ncbi:MAG: carboxypeptidase-like regulatory domain-containing protein [Bacteroidia bacterium]|nr:carboxypeptidase-like regulatory domain-containing protein [Bacteroidia bacterium]